MKIIKKTDLTILEESKKGTLILSNDDFHFFGFESRPFNLSAIPVIDGHTKGLIYQVNSIFRHPFSADKKNMTNTVYVKLVDFKLIKNELNITDEDIANLFSYKNKLAYSNSSAKTRIETALVSFYLLIKKSEGKNI